jgi:ATP-dependent Clp protease ATP-binding subunit ClpA
MAKSRRESPVHTIVRQAGDEARAAGQPAIEAEHILLAISRQADSPAVAILKDAGLDHEAIRAALNEEIAQSLQAAGVSSATFDLPAAPPAGRFRRQPRVAQSAKLVFQRAMQVASSGRNLTATTMLIGVLRAEVGTVPRALAFAGVDRIALLARTYEAHAGT